MVIGLCETLPMAKAEKMTSQHTPGPSSSAHLPIMSMKEIVDAETSNQSDGAHEIKEPDGYAYKYPDNVIRFSHGQAINGNGPIEVIPYYFGKPVPYVEKG